MTYQGEPKTENRQTQSQSTPTSVPLSEAPITASPVPWLTSIHGTPGRGDFGKADYRGNCSGLLIGDSRQQGRYLGLPFLVMNAAASVGFWLAVPEIIRFSHGATSSRQRYTTAFIPRLHDVCLVLERVQTEAVERRA